MNGQVNGKRVFFAVSCLMVLVLALYGCGGSDGGGGGAAPAATHTYNISAKGGAGNTTSGGDGGIMNITNADPSSITILETGSVDASFSATASSTASLGTTPLIINSTQTLSPSDASILNATGIKINAGVTLTLSPNLGTASISLLNSIVIEGTLITAGNLSISTGENGVHILSAGVINTSGAAASGSTGGDIAITSLGVIINNGSIRANGGSGATGGAGGLITLDSDLDLSSTGTISANGGAGTAGTGGAGGGVSLLGKANTRNSGAISANGGAGTGGGGIGGAITVEAGTATPFTGDAINSGALSANGGNAATSGNGGDGGSVAIGASKGAIKGTGALSANGGTATAGVGGSGGIIFIENGDGTDADTILLACHISASGGDGASGGTGGSIVINQNDEPTDAIAGGIEMYNYNEADLSGGGGVTSGGSGSSFAVTIWAFGGHLTNQMEIKGLGGAASNSTVGVAGNGAGVDMYALTNLTNSGVITVTGGSSPFKAGSATGVSLTAGNHVINSASILCNGGSYTGTPNAASSETGSGGDIVLGAFIGSAPAVATTNTGALNVSRGAGDPAIETSGPGTIVIDGATI